MVMIAKIHIIILLLVALPCFFVYWAVIEFGQSENCITKSVGDSIVFQVSDS